jgi:hypothetical protein
MRGGVGAKLDGVQSISCLTHPPRPTPPHPPNDGGFFSNVNDGGFFSIEVLRAGCKRFGDLALLSATSEEVVGAAGEGQEPDLTREQAFLCNRAEHWFTMYVCVNA